MSRISETSDTLILLDSLEDFVEHVDKLIQAGRRDVKILSRTLEPALYDRDIFVKSLSCLARSHPQARVEILLKNTKSLAENGHKIVRLAQRLPSKINIRRLTIEPEDDAMAFMIVDKDKLLFKNDESSMQGFANLEAGPEVKHLMDTWERLWQNSEADPQLRPLSL